MKLPESILKNLEPNVWEKWSEAQIEYILQYHGAQVGQIPDSVG